MGGSLGECELTAVRRSSEVFCGRTKKRIIRVAIACESSYENGSVQYALTYQSISAIYGTLPTTTRTCPVHPEDWSPDEPFQDVRQRHSFRPAKPYIDCRQDASNGADTAFCAVSRSLLLAPRRIFDLVRILDSTHNNTSPTTSVYAIAFLCSY